MILDRIQLRRYRKKWREKNMHNETWLFNMFDMTLVSAGKHTYGSLNVLTFNNINKLSIGNYVSIAPDVMFIPSADHYIDRLSTFPYKVKVLNEKYEAISKGDIIVDDDVWLGYGSTILSGVHIGQGAVIAAGSVVTKDVPPYAIVGGVPAKVIKYRFEDKVIEELLKLDYSKLDKELITEHIEDLYCKLDETVDLSWFPKK